MPDCLKRREQHGSGLLGSAQKEELSIVLRVQKGLLTS